jgi:hypothetical protein
MNTTAVALRTSAAAMVDAYTEATEEIRQAYQLLDTAQARLRAAFLTADAHARFDVMPPQHHSTDYTITVPRDLSGPQADGYTVRARIKCQAWATLAARLEMRSLMSTARAEQLDKELRNADKLPDVTLAAIVGMLETHTASLDTYVTEAVREVFEFLRPHRSEYKTNTEFAVGPRVILHAFYDDKWVTRPSLDYRLRQNWHNLDNVFHLLDGKGPVPHTSPLVAAIEACQTFGQVVTTEYFQARIYAKGTAHVTFRRPDLVAQLNAVAGGARLTPARP